MCYDLVITNRPVSGQQTQGNKTMPETNTAVAAQPAAAPQPKTAAKIHVNKPTQKKGFDPSDAEARKAWIAKKRAEHQKVLTESGYAPVAVLAVMKYMSTQHGYEKKASKDNLCFMFADFAACLKYRVGKFDRDMSAAIAMCIVDANANIASENNILNIEEAEASKKVQDIINHAWKVNCDLGPKRDDMQRIKQFFIHAIRPDIEGFVRRAKYFVECIVDLMLTTIDPFEGMFHEEELQKPAGFKHRGVMPPRPAKQKCPKCGETMLYLFNIQKHICTNPLCEDYRPPRKKREDGEGGQRRPFKKGGNKGEGFRSGKPIKTQSGADRFKQRYANAKKAEPRVFKAAAPTEEKIIKDINGKDKKITVQKKFETGAGTWDALDALKIPPETTAEQPAVSEAPAEAVAPAAVEVTPTAEPAPSAPVEPSSEAQA